jgi:hypothetical protein
MIVRYRGSRRTSAACMIGIGLDVNADPTRTRQDALADLDPDAGSSDPYGLRRRLLDHPLLGGRAVHGSG